MGLLDGCTTLEAFGVERQGIKLLARWNAISQVVQSVNPSIVCFQETKMEVVSPEVVRHCLGNRLENFIYLPAVGTRGGILIAWDATTVLVSNPHRTTNTLTALVKPMVGAEWWLTGVYGPQSNNKKIEFLQELIDIRDLHVGLWVIAGDFNLLVNPEDKSNDAINHRMMAHFRSKINRLELRELYLNGQKYTWSNERQRPTLEKIDHVFASHCWEDLHPVCLLTALGSAVSDHCPLLLDLNANIAMGRRFRFKAFWTKAEGFMDMVAAAWHSVPSDGNAFIALNNKLRATAKALQSWSDRWIGNVKMQTLIALEVIACLDAAMDSRELSVGEHDLRKLLKRKLLGLASLQRSIARQRSRLLQLKEGEANTAYFHRQACHRQRKNTILSLQCNGQVHTSQVDITNAVDDFYERMFGSAPE